MWLRAVVLLLLVESAASESFLKPSGIQNQNLEDSRNETIVKTVVEIISKFYEKRSSTLDFIKCSENSESSLVTDDIVGKIMEQTELSILLEDCKDIRITGRRKFFNFYFVDSHNSFRRIFKKMTTGRFNFQGYYLIVMTKSFDENQVQTRILEDLWSSYIVNVNVVQMSTRSKDQCDLFTYFPYSEIYCEEVHPVVLSTYHNGKGFNNVARWFPNKMQNLYQCPISVAIFSNPPFIVLQNSDSIGGIDGFLLQALSKQMNFTFVKRILSRGSWGYLDEYGNSTGAFKMVMDNEVNLTGGFFLSTPLRNSWMSSSYEYYTTSVVWVIPPMSPLDPFERFAKPFHASIWICLIFSLIIGIAAVLVIGRLPKRVRNFVFGRNIRHPALNLINVMLGGAMVKLPARNFARTLLGLFLAYTLVIRSAYSGALFRFLQMENTRQDVLNFDEMVSKNYELFVFEAFEEYMRIFEGLAYRTSIVNYKNFPGITQTLLTPETKIALLVSEDHVASWNKRTFPNQFFETLPEKVSIINLCLYMHKRSCLTPEINRKIFDFNSNGLIQAWLHIWIDKSYLKRKSTGNEPKKLTMEELKGGYWFLAIGLLAAVLVFLVEIVIKRFW